MSRPCAARLLVLALASSAGVHAALAPHPRGRGSRAGGDVRDVGAALTAVALRVDRGTDPVDAVGAITKLVEAAGLLLALRLLHTPAGRVKALPALREGAGP